MLCVLVALVAAPINVGLGVHADGSSSLDPSSDSVVDIGSLAAALSLDGVLAPAHVSALYSPSLRYTKTSNTSAASWMQSLRVAADGKDEQLTIAAGAGGAYGKQDFSPLAIALTREGDAPAPPSIDRLPAVRFIDVLSADAHASLQYAFDRRFAAGIAATAGSSGALDDADAVTLPRQRSVGISTTATFVATHLDAFGFAASASQGWTLVPGSATRTALLFSSSASWTRRIDPWTVATLAAGVGTTRTGQGEQTVVLPVGTASLTHAVPLRGEALSFTLSASAQPVIDSLSGVGYVQGTGTASSTWSPSRWVSFGATLSGARSLSGPFADRWGAAGELVATFNAAAATALRIGAREALVPRDLAGQQSTRANQVSEWSVFGGVATAFKGLL